MPRAPEGGVPSGDNAGAEWLKYQLEPTGPRSHAAREGMQARLYSVIRRRLRVDRGSRERLMYHITLRFGRTLSRVALPLLVCGSVVQSQAPDSEVAVADSLPAMSRASLSAARDEALAARLVPFGMLAADLRRLYGSGSSALLWTSDAGLTPAARATLDALLRLGDRGVDPEVVGVSRVREMVAQPLAGEAERLAFDLELSAASLRALRVLHGVRDGDDGVRGKGDDQNAVGGNRGIGGRPRASGDSAAARRGAKSPPAARSADTPLLPSPDLLPELRALASADARPDGLFDAAEPQSAAYRRLRNAVGTYRTLSERTPMARVQLARILSTLERARLNRDADAAARVVVNIPAFRLRATGGNGAADTLAMPVVVGVSGQHRTPEMRDSIRYIVFAPYWEVPASITRAELLPIARRDPRLLTLNNFQMIDRRGRVLPATHKSVKLLAAGRARVRQLSGGTNSLGRVKFMFPNSDDIYLHDTPVAGDFSRVRRDQSHGCVRVADPLALAKFLLRDQPDWTTERIEAAMNGKAPVTVQLTKPVPIALTYQTAVARVDGSVDFFDDIYHLDVARRY